MKNFVDRLRVLDEVLPWVQDAQTRAKGSVVLGTVTRIKEEDSPKGEVKVSYTALDPDASGNPGSQAFESPWIKPFSQFEGKAPESLIGEKVMVLLENSNWNTAYWLSPLTSQEPVGSLLRTATYDRGQLPPATANNLGAVALEKDWPPGSHSVVTVVKKNGRYIWAGSSHSITETSPLTTAAKAQVARAMAQESIFDAAADSVKSGDAFSPIKNKKERALLTVVSNVVLSAVEGLVKEVISPISQVDVQIMEAAFTRHLERINDVSTLADRIEEFAEFTVADPRSIPKALNALKSLAGDVLDSVRVISDDVRKYLGNDLTQAAKLAVASFETQVQEVLPEVTKRLPKLLGQELSRTVKGVALEELQKATSFPSQFLGGIGGEALDYIEEFLPPEVSFLFSLPQEQVDKVPGDWSTLVAEDSLKEVIGAEEKDFFITSSIQGNSIAVTLSPSKPSEKRSANYSFELISKEGVNFTPFGGEDLGLLKLAIGHLVQRGYSVTTDSSQLSILGFGSDGKLDPSYYLQRNGNV